MRVSGGNNSQDYTYDTPNDINNLLWSEKSFKFTADGSNTRLTFKSNVIDRASGPALDNVRLRLENAC